MRWLGKSLQLVGLIALPLAILLELSERLDRVFHVSQMVYMLVFGFAAFYVGRLIEAYGVRQSS